MDPDSFGREFSEKFERDFVNLLKLKYDFTFETSGEKLTIFYRSANKFISGNSIYNEMIRDRTHIRLNATKWAKLGDFLEVGNFKLQP